MTALFALLRALVAPLAGLWLHWQGRKSARKDADLDAAEATANAYEVRNEVDNRIALERDAKQRLRDDWQR